MTGENYLLLLYGFYPSSQFEQGSYRLMNVVDERGMVDDHSLSTALNLSLGKEFVDSQNIYFDNLDDLNKFAYSLMDDLDAPLISVLSIENYNTCLEKCSSLEEFKELLMNSSNSIENVDYTRDKGILSKIFK